MSVSPPPWKAIRLNGVWAVVDAHDDVIVSSVDADEARLIASAPMLWEVVSTLAKAIGQGADFSPYGIDADHVRQVVKDATGQP